MPTRIRGGQLDTGVGPGSIVQLDASMRLPAVDGSLLLNLPAGGILDLIDDITPQLGGALDVNGNNIIGAPAATPTSSGGSIILMGANGGATSGGGGNVLAIAGSSTDGVGGSIGLTAQASTALISTGGSITLTSGTGGSNGQGGPVNINSGAGNGTGRGGPINIVAGNAPGANQGGDILITAGDSLTGPGGNISVTVGSGNTPGIVTFKSSDTSSAPEVRFSEASANGTNYIGLRSPANIASSRTWSLPVDSAASAAGQFLTTNSSGDLSFAPSTETIILDLPEVLTTTSPANNTWTTMSSATLSTAQAKYAIVKIFAAHTGISATQQRIRTYVAKGGTSPAMGHITAVGVGVNNSASATNLLVETVGEVTVPLDVVFDFEYSVFSTPGTPVDSFSLLLTGYIV